MKLVDSSGHVYSLEWPRLTIGSASDNHVRLSGPYIDPHHAVIRRDGESWFLDYQDGMTEILVNGLPLAGYYRLHDGDRIQVGYHTFEVVLAPVRQSLVATQAETWVTAPAKVPRIEFIPISPLAAQTLPARSPRTQPAPRSKPYRQVAAQPSRSVRDLFGALPRAVQMMILALIIATIISWFTGSEGVPPFWIILGVFWFIRFFGRRGKW